MLSLSDLNLNAKEIMFFRRSFASLDVEGQGSIGIGELFTLQESCSLRAMGFRWRTQWT